MDKLLDAGWRGQLQACGPDHRVLCESVLAAAADAGVAGVVEDEILRLIGDGLPFVDAVFLAGVEWVVPVRLGGAQLARSA